MRTSKKGGRSGSWGVQASGAAVAPPLFSGVSHYQSGAPTRSVGAKILRGVGWFFLSLLVIGAGVAGGLYLYANETLDVTNLSHQNSRQAGQAQKYVKYVPPGHAAIALIAGYDHRAGGGSNSYAGSNSDTLMLMRADPTTNTLSLLSFPRDLWVNIYCGGDTPTTQNRINAAWGMCQNNGPAAVLDTMRHLTGLTPNYLITLDFHAFKQIVNRIHGVYMNVDRRYYNPLGTGWSAINLHPGYQKLDGGEALQYVRFRHLDSDIYRNARQQLFVEALKNRLKSEISITDPTLLLKLIGAMKGNLSYLTAGGGDIGIGELTTWFSFLDHLQSGSIVRNAIPITSLTNANIGGASVLTADPSAIQAAVHEFLHPHVTYYDTTHRHHAKKKKKGLSPKDVTVLVLNGGNITGEAANTSYLLSKQGFDMLTLPDPTHANAPSHTYDTVVYYDPSQAIGQKAAEELAALFGSHVSVAPMTAAIASRAHQAGDPLTVVAVGTAYKGKLKLPHHVAPPSLTTASAQVQDGVSMTLAAVRAQQRAAHFPLMVPHKVALGSALSTEEGARLFRVLGSKKEFVLTFNLNNGIEYWQIEESNWTDEPLLQNPSVRFVHKGRTYEEFTTGGKIQTIAVRRGKAVYWVQNTLLNSLSNATMIAIAESLRPHR
jgi:LCP family protein required for cell wall assembly